MYIVIRLDSYPHYGLKVWRDDIQQQQFTWPLKTLCLWLHTQYDMICAHIKKYSSLLGRAA